MTQNNVFHGEMDPEIAALLGTGGQAGGQTAAATAGQEPSFDNLFGGDFSKDLDLEELDKDEGPAKPDEQNLDFSGFPPIEKFLSDTPHNTFEDPEYYKAAMAGEGDISQRVHGLLQKYLKAKDPKDRSVFRMQAIPAYWEFLLSVGRKAPGKLSEPKKYLLRFGLMHPQFLKPEAREFLSQIIPENPYGQPVYYLDEWLKSVGTGVIKNSSTDEARVVRGNKGAQLMQLLEKAEGKMSGAKTLLRAKDAERQTMEGKIMDRLSQLTDKSALSRFQEVSSCYTEAQKRALSDVQELTKQLLRTDRELDVLVKDYFEAEKDVGSLQAKIEEEGATVEVDLKAVDIEIDTIRQMAKMTVGRQGNHFPVLSSEYLSINPRDFGHRENVISMLSWIESIDPEAFCRVHRNKLNRIVPYVVLIPSYGDFGMCWEPYDRFNRATSRGRIAIPMYSRNLKIASLIAVADLRWQVAKEKASYYWMEEGITGHYYQWFTKQKLKGDLKESFIKNYILWMTRESDGVQKLDKDLRGTFWRYLPFSQPIKEKLKTRNMVYQELYQRDINRTMSDGY